MFSETRTKPTIYVASKFQNREIVRGYIDRLEEKGYEVIYDWTRGSEGSEDELSEAKRFEIALIERDAAMKADYFWLLFPEEGGRGCFIELGMALASNHTVLISGHLEKSLFSTLSDETFEEHEEAFSFLTKELHDFGPSAA